MTPQILNIMYYRLKMDFMMKGSGDFYKLTLLLTSHAFASGAYGAYNY